MLKLKLSPYLVLLIASLILGIVYLNLFLNYDIDKVDLVSQQTGAIGAIPGAHLPPSYATTITLAIVIAGYFLWVWGESEKLKEKYQKS